MTIKRFETQDGISIQAGDDIVDATGISVLGSVQSETDLVVKSNHILYYSNQFNGNQYIGIADSAELQLGDSTAFTIEAWIYETVYYPTKAAVIVQKGGTKNVNYATYQLTLNNETVTFDTGTGTGGGPNTGGKTVASSISLPLNQWVHIAVVWNGTTIILYQNGVSVGTTAAALLEMGNNTDLVTIGTIPNGGPDDTFVGKISNLRIVKNTAVYTEAFTPSSTPLTAITNTSLLTCNAQTIDPAFFNNTIIVNESPFGANGDQTWTFGDDGILTFPGGANVRDLSGATTNDSILILGAGATVAENQRAARVALNGSVEGVAIGAGTNDWLFANNGTLTLPAGGTITEGYVTSNPTIQLTPDSPDVASQKLVIKGGGNYDYTQNDININYYNNTALVGDTLTFYINSPTYADQTLYWWIYPQGADISDPGSGTVVLTGSSGSFSFVLDSDDNEFTVRVSPVADNYDPANTGVETGLINADAPTFDSPHHLHLTTGNLAETSIFLGTDDHNVRTTVNGGIEITTPNTINNVWQFGADGNLALPGAVVNSTTAKTGSGVPGTGEVATMTASPTSNSNFIPGIYSGLFLGLGSGISLTLEWPGFGDFIITITGSGAGFNIGDQAILNGAAIPGGTTGVDDITLTVATLTNIATPTALDLTKQVQKLTDGYYTLANGVEGQVMHLVRQTGATVSITVIVANARVAGAQYTTIEHYPFTTGDMNMLIFTDGAWQAMGGTWD